MSENGLITITSNHSVKETLDRLEASLRGNGVTVFARIDHAAGAAAVDMSLPPTELIIFGQPKAGTPLMQAQQSIGIDLPLKMLAWQDASGKNWLAYNDVAWLAKRHGLGEDLAPAISGIAKALAKLAETAAA
ncbi:MAG TPA: DUF302 domain-containing protein [Dongiaceae bacterium]|nr:DUF302 domain-containing protein [Dongiaceae bacterium]